MGEEESAFARIDESRVVSSGTLLGIQMAHYIYIYDYNFNLSLATLADPSRNARSLSIFSFLCFSISICE
jgi:hypothetical protein